MRILLTGAAGFLGSNLATRFIQRGDTVVGIDNLSTGRQSNLEELLKNERFELRQADVCEPLTVEGGIDWVMHFASPASPPKYLADPVGTMRVNSEGTRHLLELARTKNAKFFYASTSECYGDPLVHPQPESYWGNVNPIGPRSVYDEAKRYGEAMTFAYHRAYGVPIRVARFFNTYGPNMDPEDGRVVSNLVCQALSGRALTLYGDGSQTRSFQYVDDLVEGICRFMEADHTGPMNLGNPDEYTVRQLAELVQELTGSTAEMVLKPLPVDDPKQRKPDIALARQILGWQPQVHVKDGLTKTIAYFKTVLAK